MTFRDLLKGNQAVPEELAEETQSPRYTGVKGRIFFLNQDEGWGFIEATNQPELKFKRIYFHWQWLIADTYEFENLERGMEVEFEAREHERKGWRAIKVRVIEPDEKENNNASKK